MLIKNYQEIATTKMRQMALDIITAGIETINPKNLMYKEVGYSKTFNSVVVQNHSYDLIRDRIFVVGGGKAAGLMAEALEGIIGPENVTAGIVTVKTGSYETKKIKVVKAGHPLPDEKGVAAVEDMFKLKEKYNINEKDLVICLLSGGGSALMPAPVADVSLKDKRAVTDLLIKLGASITEINTIRKHLSLVKGGRLAEWFTPTKVVAIIISDVIGNDFGTIASGPTTADPTTFNDVYDILNKYNLLDKIPRSVLAYLVKGRDSEVADTPKNLTNADNYLLGDNSLALEAMATKVRELGLKPLIASAHLGGDPAIAAREAANIVVSREYEGIQAFLFGGETTPKVPSEHGEGGRNLHFAAASLLAMKDFPKNWVMISFDSDGEDFVTSAAGAIIDQGSFTQANNLGLDVGKYLEAFDTYNLFKKLGNSLIITGPTGTNVADLVLFLLN